VKYYFIITKQEIGWTTILWEVRNMPIQVRPHDWLPRSDRF